MNKKKMKIVRYNGKMVVRLALAILMTGGMLASCELNTSDNGKLDGFWHLERVDTLATGGYTDLSQQRRFWAVQAKLINMRDADYDNRGYYFRFKQTSDSLILKEPYGNHWHEDQKDGGDVPVTDVEELTRYGVNNLEEHYHKESLTGSHMTLKSKTLRLFFTKF